MYDVRWVQNGYRTDGSHSDIYIHLHDGTATEWPRYSVVSAVDWFTVVGLREAVRYVPGTDASPPRGHLHALAKFVLRRVARWPGCAAHAQYARTAVGEIAHWRWQLQGQLLIFVQSIDRSHALLPLRAICKLVYVKEQRMNANKCDKNGTLSRSSRCARDVLPCVPDTSSSSTSSSVPLK